MYDLESLENRRDFSQQQITALFIKYGIRRSYAKSEIIFSRGEDAHGVFYVKSGKVRGYFSPIAGDEFTVTILGQGILIGEDAFMSPPRRILDVVALRPSVLYYMKTEDLLMLSSEDTVALKELIGFFMKKILTLSYQMIASLQLCGDKKIAFLLLEMNAQEGDIIAYTHEELAGMSGLSRVTATKLLRALEQKGAISLQYKKIMILNRTLLLEVLHS